MNRFRITKIQQRGIPVPPFDDGRVSGRFPCGLLASFLHQETFVFQELSHQLGLIRTDKRAQPNHHLEAQTMQFIHHLLGLGKPARMKIPDAIVLLPSVINHQHARRQTIGNDSPRILQNVFLILIVGQFNPGVVLRLGEQ